MKGHLTQQLMTRFRHNELSADELLALDDHLKECRECARSAAEFDSDAARVVGSALMGAGSAAHLTYEQLEGLADGSLGGAALERSEAHSAECADCRAEIESFRALAVKDGPAAAGSPGGFFERVRGLFANPLVPIGAAAALLLTVGLVLWLNVTGRQDEVAVDAVRDPTNVAEQTAIIPAIDDTNSSTPYTDSNRAAELAMSLSDGGRVVGLDETGRLVGFDAASPKYQSLLKDSLRNERIPAADISDLRAKTAAMMGDAGEPAESFTIVGPVGRVVDTNAPALRWRAMDGAEGYSVDVYDQNYNKVASSGKLDANSWTPRLQRGRTYVWQVTAVKNGQEIKAPQRPAPEARFRILDADRSAEIAALKRGGNASHLMLALAYSEAGLFDDAEREMRKVVAANPRSPLARKFLEQIKARSR
jgi:hypothetical protein